VTDLERFFRRMVSNLAATDPGLLDQPVALADVPVSIVPYRSNRRALGVESSEEYEMVLLRLCAGEGGFIRTDPDEVRQRFGEEVRSANPDLEVLHRFEDVVLTLRPELVGRALSPPPIDLDQARAAIQPSPPAPHAAPMQEEPELYEEPEKRAEPEFPAADEPVGSQCVYCGGGLPSDRSVNFCPYCGQSQVAMVCPACHCDVETGWRHCVNCGVALGSR
jgi:hypothetical protein